MSELITYLADNLEQASESGLHILIDSHFRLRNGPEVNDDLLTLNKSGEMHRIAWDSKLSEYVAQDDVIAESVELSASVGKLYVKVGKTWKSLEFEAINEPLLEWLLQQQSPLDKARICKSLGDGTDSMCQPPEAVPEKKKKAVVAVAAPKAPKVKGWSTGKIALVAAMVLGGVFLVVGILLWMYRSSLAPTMMANVQASSLTPPSRSLSSVGVPFANESLRVDLSQFDEEPMLQI